MQRQAAHRPRIVVTVAVAADKPDPVLAERKNRLYAEAVERAGGEAVLVDSSSSTAARTSALESMDGLVLSGGADIDPRRYGATHEGAEATEPLRDVLERAAWDAAETRDIPVLGICRGLQAINVFSGGRLLQHVAEHAGTPFGQGAAGRHPLRLVAGSMLARILVPTNVRGGVLEVNTYHHQAVRRADLAPGLVASALAASREGELVEGLESSSGDRLVIGVQCHPERTESTPAEFERLWRFFVDACRGPAGRR